MVYRSNKDNVAVFSPIQLGLSVFSRAQPSGSSGTDQPGKLRVRSYNFYLFPSGGLLTSQCTSLAFLAEHKFNFNKLFLHGINAVRADEAERLRAREERKSAPSDLSLSAEEVKSLEDLGASSRAWLLKASNGDQLSLGTMTSYQRMMIFKELPKRLGEDLNFSIDSIGPGKGIKQVVLTALSKEGLDKKRALDNVKNTEELQMNIGFRLVFELLVQARKPLVGHNMTFDLLHLYNRFEDYLPESFVEFKAAIHRLFPLIVDTKVLVSAILLDHQELRLQHTSLEEVHNAVHNDPVFLKHSYPAVGGAGQGNGNKLHDAAYDAYLTGTAAVRLLSFIETTAPATIPCVISEEAPATTLDDDIESSEEGDAGEEAPRVNTDWSVFESHALAHLVNILHQTTTDNWYLASEQPPPDRSNTYFVTGMEQEHTTQVVIDMLDCRAAAPDIKWIDDSSLFLTINPEKFEGDLLAKAPKPLKLITYEAWRIQQQESDQARVTPTKTPKRGNSPFSRVNAKRQRS